MTFKNVMSDSTIESANREREDMNADWMGWLEYVLETDREEVNENALRNVARLLANHKEQNDGLQILTEEWRREYVKSPIDNYTASQVKNHVLNCADEVEELLE